jgi:hypothetical protein
LAFKYFSLECTWWRLFQKHFLHTKFDIYICIANLMMVVWFMVFQSLSTLFHLYRGCQFYWWRKPEYPEKTTDLMQVIDNLYHIMLYRVHLTWTGFELTTLVAIGTDCIGSYKSNYHTITTMTAPQTRWQVNKESISMYTWFFNAL